jgi:hypothetical protein
VAASHPEHSLVNSILPAGGVMVVLVVDVRFAASMLVYHHG